MESKEMGREAELHAPEPSQARPGIEDGRLALEQLPFLCLQRAGASIGERETESICPLGSFGNGIASLQSLAAINSHPCKERKGGAAISILRCTSVVPHSTNLST